MSTAKGVSRTTIVAILAVIIVVAGLGWYFTLPPPAPKLKDTIIWGTTDSVEKTVDPAQAYDFFGWCIIQQIGGTLVEVRPGSGVGPNDYIPALATDWSVSADKLTWTFNLRQDVKFEDGTEFNATHVKYSFDRSMGLAIEEGPQVGIDYYSIIDSIEVKGTYQVAFHLKIPFGPFLGVMACQASGIVNPKYAPMDAEVDYVDGDARASHPNDLGRYTLTKWQRVAGKDVEIDLEANPNYWNASGGWPKTKNIIIKMYSDATALRLALEAGDVDVAFRQLTPSDIVSLSGKTDVKVWEGVGAQIQYILFQEKIAPFNDPRARRALAAAVNRTAVCQTVFLGQKQPLYSIIPMGMAGHTEAFKALGDANYTLTRSLLAELGYNESHKLEVDLWYETSGHYPSSADQALVYKASFEASGVITVTLKSADWASYRANRNAEIMPVYIYGWYPDYNDPDDYVFLYWTPWTHQNYNNPAMVALYDQARSTADATQKSTLYSQIETMAVQDCPLVPLWQGKAFAASKPNVGGIVLDVTENFRLWLLYETE